MTKTNRLAATGYHGPGLFFFKAKRVALWESWSTQDHRSVDKTEEGREAQKRRFIRAEIYPDSPDRRPPVYSMLGTDRLVSKFMLQIEQIPRDQDEHCSTYGIVSYTTEVDFRDVTEEDSLWIYVYLHITTFADYAERIASNEIDSLTVQVAHVAGFYSDWSPSITTDKIRILTADRNHKVDGIPKDVSVGRLGEVHEAKLYFVRETNLPPTLPELDEIDDTDLAPDERLADRAAKLEVIREKRAQETVQLIRNLRIAAWVLAVLLFALLLK